MATLTTDASTTNTTTANTTKGLPCANDMTEPAIVMSGMETGLVAGFIMIIVAMIQSALTGAGFWTPINWIAATWFGDRAVAGGTLVGLVGAGTHLVVSILWGSFFALLVGRLARSFMASLAMGFLTGICAWLVMTYLVLPFANPLLRAQASVTPVFWIVEHLIFGASLALTPFFARATIGRKSVPIRH